MLFHASEMHIQFVEMFQKRTERSAFGHLSEGIDILRKTLAAIAELAVRSRDVGMRVVDIT